MTGSWQYLWLCKCWRVIECRERTQFPRMEEKPSLCAACGEQDSIVVAVGRKSLEMQVFAERAERWASVVDKWDRLQVMDHLLCNGIEGTDWTWEFKDK